MYAVSYARSGETPVWAARDIEAWRATAAGSVEGEAAGRSLQSFGTANRGSLAVFDDVINAAPHDSRPRVCMVDHNAPWHMVPALKRAVVDEGDTDCLVGIINHHALDRGCFTKGLTFIDVRPWGSMSTIVAHSFVRSARAFPVDFARLLLCAILSDTVNLTSPTTTLADKYIVPLVSKFCGESDCNRLAQQLFKAKTARFVTLSAFEMVRADQKNFTTAAGVRWGWATVEVNEPDKLLQQTDQLLLEQYHLKQEKQLHLVFLSVINLAAKTPVVLLSGPGGVSLAQAAFPKWRLFNSSPAGEFNAEDLKNLSQMGIELDTCCMDVGALMSRKKEFKPAVDEVLSAGTMPEPEAVNPRARLRTIVTTMIDQQQKLKRCFSLKEDAAPCAA